MNFFKSKYRQSKNYFMGVLHCWISGMLLKNILAPLIKILCHFFGDIYAPFLLFVILLLMFLLLNYFFIHYHYHVKQHLMFLCCFCCWCWKFTTFHNLSSGFLPFLPTPTFFPLTECFLRVCFSLKEYTS